MELQGIAERVRIAEEEFGWSENRYQSRFQALKEQRAREMEALLERQGMKRGGVEVETEEGEITEQQRAPPLSISIQHRRPSDVFSPTTATTPRSAPTPPSASTPSSASAPFSRRVSEDQTNGEGTGSPYVPPEWYNEVKVAGYHMKELDKPAKRAILTKLQRIKDTIKLCEKHAKEAATLLQYFNELRFLIHEAEFLLVDEHILKKRRMLDNGLNLIFNARGTVDFPWDLKADALQLYRRWAAKHFSIELLRGIDTKKTENRSADSIDPAWRKFANYHGEGKLVLGQWWPTQLCTVRDGAHGAAQAGIYGETGKGAYSIVLSDGGGYKDKDNGDEIFYSGTDSKDNKPTAATTRLMETVDISKEPVRVIRSANLKKDNPYRPARGYRYDGLYDVVSYELVKEETAGYLFKVVRRPGQNPIRYEQDKPSSRPTIQEIAAYDNEVGERIYELQAQSVKGVLKKSGPLKKK